MHDDAGTGQCRPGCDAAPGQNQGCSEADPLSPLTPREFEIFLLLANSHSVNQISELLSLSLKTAGHHCTSIKNKLEISDIAGLARLATRLGLVTP